MINSFTRYLCEQLIEKGVDIRVNTKATREIVENINPEVIISATGAFPLIPPLSGVNSKNVISAWEAFVHPEKVDRNVVIIGGGMVGCEVAAFLTTKNKNITIVEQLEEIGLGIGPSLKKFKVEKLEKAGVTIITTALARKITEEGVVVEDHNEMSVLSADTVVIAVGAKSDRELLKELETGTVEVYAIGDCVVPRRIVQATAQGYYLGAYI